MTGRATILRADARSLPIPDASVDLVVTSPPYFALRSYQDGGRHYDGQVGDEATPHEFVDALLEVTAECVRVLKPAGSLWVNLGDKYATSVGQGNGIPGKTSSLRGRDRLVRAYDVTDGRRTNATAAGIRAKSLIGVPWRYAIRCVDELGLILRAEVIWSKPNGLPESVTDRVRRSHETWFHLVKQPRYYSAVDEIRTQPVRVGDRKPAAAYAQGVMAGRSNGHDGLGDRANHPLGSLPGSVWEIATQPLQVPAELGVDHFAAFPMEWPRRLVAGWSPQAICTACGEGRRPTTEPTGERGREPGGRTRADKRTYTNLSSAALVVRTITGYVCACTPYTDHEGVKVERAGNHLAVPPRAAPRTTNGSLGKAPTSGAWREYHLDDWTPASTRPGVVLDPFGGTGTTALVAKALGRHGISVDLSADYCRLARWRTTDPGELARAMQVDKPRPQVDGQDALFALEEL